MQKGHLLSFKCRGCQEPVHFSILEIRSKKGVITCASCGATYALGDPVLRRQIEKFEALCRQIADSEEILSNASVGIDLNGHQVRIPYRILLTRLNSKLDLVVDDEKLSIEFRLEPRADVPVEEPT